MTSFKFEKLEIHIETDWNESGRCSRAFLGMITLRKQSRSTNTPDALADDRSSPGWCRRAAGKDVNLRLWPHFQPCSMEGFSTTKKKKNTVSTHRTTRSYLKLAAGLAKRLLLLTDGAANAEAPRLRGSTASSVMASLPLVYKGHFHSCSDGVSDLCNADGRSLWVSTTRLWIGDRNCSISSCQRRKAQRSWLQSPDHRPPRPYGAAEPAPPQRYGINGSRVIVLNK